VSSISLFYNSVSTISSRHAIKTRLVVLQWRKLRHLPLLLQQFERQTQFEYESRVYKRLKGEKMEDWVLLAVAGTLEGEIYSSDSDTFEIVDELHFSLYALNRVRVNDLMNSTSFQ
jgi:hypothetical protein